MVFTELRPLPAGTYAMRGQQCRHMIRAAGEPDPPSVTLRVGLGVQAGPVAYHTFDTTAGGAGFTAGLHPPLPIRSRRAGSGGIPAWRMPPT